jgi:leader peptidase (prepilin peptidase) / N-methyltransferase
MALPFFLFILGATVGSFLNVCIWRLPRHESVVHPPSHCPKCDTRLAPMDLVPLFSQLFLRSRCRYCGNKISWRYFGIELLTGVLFALVGMQPQWANDPVLIARGLIFMATLVVIFWVDYDVRLIQLEAVLLLGLAGIAVDIWQDYQMLKIGYAPVSLTYGTLFGEWNLLPAPLPQSLFAMIVTAGVLWILRELFSLLYGREAMGFGDVLLVAAIAANLGWNATILTFFFLAFAGGAPLAIGLQVPAAIRAYRWGRRRQRRYGSERDYSKALARRTLRRSIPFGPMLALAAVMALLYGPRLNQAYLNLWTVPAGVAIAPTARMVGE